MFSWLDIEWFPNTVIVLKQTNMYLSFVCRRRQVFGVLFAPLRKQITFPCSYCGCAQRRVRALNELEGDESHRWPWAWAIVNLPPPTTPPAQNTALGPIPHYFYLWWWVWAGSICDLNTLMGEWLMCPVGVCASSVGLVFELLGSANKTFMAAFIGLAEERADACQGGV